LGLVAPYIEPYINLCMMRRPDPISSAQGLHGHGYGRKHRNLSDKSDPSGKAEAKGPAAVSHSKVQSSVMPALAAYKYSGTSSLDQAAFNTCLVISV
jgi:hypothetical protein